MFDVRKTIVGAVTAGFMFVGSQATMAAALQSWELFNFPSGALGSPDYGLRLDGLFGNGSGSNGDWTFSFEDELGNSTVSMTLFDDDSLNISGQVFGGQRNGNSLVSGTEGVWDLDFTYNSVNSGPASSDSLPVTATGSSNTHTSTVGSGTLSSTYIVAGQSSTGTINFNAQSDSNGLFFEYVAGADSVILGKCQADETSANECDRAIARGWVTHGVNYGVEVTDQTAHIYSSDFQFTGSATVVPLPASILFMIAGLAGLGALKIRRTS